MRLDDQEPSGAGCAPVDDATSHQVTVPRVSYTWALCNGLCTKDQADRRALDAQITLRDLRRQRGLSLRDLRGVMAHYGVRVDKGELSRYERGLRRPLSLRIVDVWAQVLDVPRRELIFPARAGHAEGPDDTAGG